MRGAPPVSERAAAAAERPAQVFRLLWLLLAFVLVAVPFVVNDYVQFVVNTILVYCLVAVGFNVVLGYLGELAFASAAFFGIGAYGTGLAMAHLRLPYLPALAAGAVLAAAAGLLVSLPALRVRGYYLAIVTLAFGELMRWAYVHGDPFTYGPSGFNVPLPAVFGIGVLDSDVKRYPLFVVVVVLGIAATRRILASRYGRAFVAVRDNPMAASSAGIPVARTKIIAFVWSGLITGLGGGLYAVLNGRVTPDTFGLGQMLLHFVIVMIGGLGSLTGSVIGAVLLTAAPEFLRNVPGIEEIVFSLLLIVVLVLMPRGIGGVLAEHVPALHEKLYRR